MEEHERLLKPSEFGELIGCSKKRVQNLLARRKFPGAVRIPGVIGWRIPYSVFLELIEKGRVEKPAGRYS